MPEAFKKNTAFILIIFLCLSLLLTGCGTKSNGDDGNLPGNSTKEQTTENTSTQGTQTQAPSSTDSTVPQSAPDKKLPPVFVGPEKVREAEDLYSQGFDMYLNRKYDEAIKLFDKAIETDPNCYKAYNGKGISLCFKGKYTEGMELISKALEIKPDFVYANFNMALAYKLKKDYNVALVWFDKALSYDPRDTWSYYGKACIYAEWDDEPKAIENLKRAIDIDPAVKEVAKSEPDLDKIKNNPDFIKLMK